MYGELGAVQGLVDLSPREVLDRAESLLERQGYRTTQRTRTSLFVERSQSDQRSLETGKLYLTVSVSPQPGGGVRVTIRGNDQEGVDDRQAEWTEWAESLPKKGTAERHVQPQAHPSSSSEAPGRDAENKDTEKHQEEGSIAPGQRREGSPDERVTQASSEETAGRGSGSVQGSGAWTSVAPWGGTVRPAPGKQDEAPNSPSEGREVPQAALPPNPEETLHSPSGVEVGRARSVEQTEKSLPVYEYHMVQIPPALAVEQGQHRGDEAARFLQTVANEQSEQGWEFYRIDSFTVSVAPGCFGALFGANPTQSQHYVVTFRRPRS